jgi:type III secretion system low calcium response chaperone LcrH/SycD
MADANKFDQEENKQLIHEAVESVQDKVPSKVLPLIEDALIKIENEGLTPQEAMGISDDVIEEIYEHGYHFFKSGKFKDALAIFSVLNQLVGGSDPRYLFAIAATHHHMKNYVEAAGYYMIYEALHPTDPLPYFHLYDCFKKDNKPEMAVNALKAALRLCEKDPKYADLKAKIELELKNPKDGTPEKQSTAA